jgi:hypothetical protein
MGRRDGNHSPQKNISIEDSVGNEENGYPNKNMINVTQEPNDTTIKLSKRKLWKKSLKDS